MKYKKVLFRSDSSSQIGLGHLMRDLVLAKKFIGSEIYFAVQELEGNANYKILESGYNLQIINSFENFINLLQIEQFELIVVDNYSITYKDEKQIKAASKSTLMVLDDTYKKHYCDILLNHNLGSKKERYQDLVPPNCEVYCGEKFTLIRDEFKKYYRKKTSKKRQLFIAMGGSDTFNFTSKILKELQDFKAITIHVVTTSSNPHLKLVKKFAFLHRNIKLHINSNSLASIMQQCDFAIVSASVIAHEIYFMKIPFMTILTAENQKEVYTFLSKQESSFKKIFTLKESKKLHTLKRKLL